MSKDRQVWLFAASLIVAITASPVAKAGINDDEFLDNTYPATTTVGALARVGEGVDSEGSNAASISAHYPFSGSAYGSASAYASSDELAQQVNATATVNTSLLGQSEGVGSASLSFYFKTIFSHADAAGNALVSISGNYSIPNQAGADQSSVSLTITNTLTNSLLYSLDTSAAVFTPAGNAYNELLPITVDTPYLVTMTAIASLNNVSGSVDASLDPQFTLVGPDSGDFQLLFSQGIGNGVTSAVPEPSTWAMIILGFAGMGFIAYRRKEKLLNAAV